MKKLNIEPNIIAQSVTFDGKRSHLITKFADGSISSEPIDDSEEAALLSAQIHGF